MGLVIAYEKNPGASSSHPLIVFYTMQIPFGYTRKDVLLIGLGITALGVGLKYGLEVPHFLFFSYNNFLHINVQKRFWYLCVM